MSKGSFKKLPTFSAENEEAKFRRQSRNIPRTIVVYYGDVKRKEIEIEGETYSIGYVTGQHRRVTVHPTCDASAGEIARSYGGFTVDQAFFRPIKLKDLRALEEEKERKLQAAKQNQQKNGKQRDKRHRKRKTQA